VSCLSNRVSIIVRRYIYINIYIYRERERERDHTKFAAFMAVSFIKFFYIPLVPFCIVVCFVCLCLIF
jgi:hypothetical protein